MKPMDFSRSVLLWSSCVMMMVGNALTSQLLAAEKPNVVFVLTDDQRWDQLSCAGHPFLKTPHIDRLAEEGARFDNMFVTTSLCSPSRASFLSGVYANTHGVVNNFTDYPRDLPSFPLKLQDAGYQTAYIGKWHMGEADDSKRPGFDYWVTHKGQGDYFDTTFNVDGDRKVVPGYYTKVVTELAINWLKEDHQGQPFLLILGHKAPHTPFTPEPKYQDIYSEIPIGYPRTAFHLEGKPKWIEQRLDTWHGIYGPLYGFRKDYPDRSAAAVVDFDRFVQSYSATICSVDDSVGRLYQTLKDLGQLENTVFIFAGDNGMFLGEHGMSDKRAMHEPSIRVPQIVRYPKLIKPGTVIEEQVLNIDMAPSVVELASAEPFEKVHGMSWVPLLKGKSKKWRKAWYYEYNYEVQFPYTPNVRGVRTDRWKYMRYPHGDGSPDKHLAELYDLKNDPGEKVNLIKDPKFQHVVKELRSELDRLIEETGNVSYKKMPIDEGIKSSLPDVDIR
ncbi:Mucin-desulfating sulfatase [Planctomycetales bacterium 10988]|nr:Mucin-desulfating sulfatase [Planctomycetales bacterium 10988]